MDILRMYSKYAFRQNVNMNVNKMKIINRLTENEVRHEKEHTNYKINANE